MNPGDRPAIFRIVLIYFVFSAAWIFLSDRLLEAILRTPQAISLGQTYKGWLFVLLSAGLIAYLLIREQKLRLRREGLLLTSQRSFTSLLDGSSTPMWIYDLYSRELLVANQAALDDFGFSPVEFLHLKIEDLWFAEDQQTSENRQERTLSYDQGGKAQSHENQAGENYRNELRLLRRKDGELIRVETTTYPIVFAGHIAALVSAVDVTQREAMQAAAQAAEDQRKHDQEALKNIEEALLQSDARLHTAIENLPFDFWMMDRQGRYVMQNAASLAHWGNLIGRLNTELDLPAGLREVWDSQNRRALNGESGNIELSYTRPDGELVSEYSVVSPVMDRGAVLGILGINLDISDLKQREGELRLIISVANALRTLTTRSEIEPELIDQVTHQIGIQAAALVHLENERSEVVFDLSRGDWANLTGLRIPIDEVHTQVLREGRPFQSDDFSVEGLARSGLKSAICVPLIAFEQILGGLWVGSQKPLGEADLHLLTAVADIAASSIHRGILAEQKELNLQRLTSLRSIDLAITASLDIHLTLIVLLTQIASQLKIDAADVLLYSPETQTLDYAASRGFRTQELRNIHVHLGEGLAGRIALGRKVEFISNLADQPEVMTQGLNHSNEGFISYAGIPLTAKGEIKGLIELYSRECLFPDEEWFEFLQAVASRAAIAVDNAALFDRLQRSNAELTVAYDATIEGWAHALELREQEINGHTRHVSEWSLHLARYAGFTDEEIVHLRRGVLLHDIGKMAIPDSILLKPGALTDAEWETMKLHPQYAYEMLSPIPYLHASLEIPYCHHEHWDGSGYPRGLSGEQIPRAARLFTVIDVWDALLSARPNREAWLEADVLTYLNDQAGKKLDPEFVALFLEHYPEEKQRHLNEAG
ncbi:MAG: GAF domain-containing protein [Anaerolineaceae bacterium]|nr:GAF domain-containing protein [Anaerolineaceae bacterium]